MEWVEVAEKKPPYCRKVLATNANWIIRMLVVARMNDNQWWPMHFEHPIVAPTHWMELPEPPKSNEKAKQDSGEVENG